MTYIDDLRERYGGDEADALFQRLAETDERHAELDARYGAGGTWDPQRKAHRSLHAIRIREELAEAGKKATEPMVEELAAAHPEVRAWLDHAEREQIEYRKLTNERELLRERIRWLRALAYAAGGEARLG